MKATTLNNILWSAVTAALAGHALTQGWDAWTIAGSIFGYALICGALWLVTNDKLKERD